MIQLPAGLGLQEHYLIDQNHDAPVIGTPIHPLEATNLPRKGSFLQDASLRDLIAERVVRAPGRTPKEHEPMEELNAPARMNIPYIWRRFLVATPVYTPASMGGG